MLPSREKNSHKGENGKVLVVGGNERYHGAPIFAALGAEKTGVDLVYLIVPKNQQTLARQYSLNILVETFSEDFFQKRDVKKVIDVSKRVDVMVIGNGLGERKESMEACEKIFQHVSLKLVIDAAALLPFVKKAPLHSCHEIVLTPHRGEFSRMIGKDVSKLSLKTLKPLLQKKAQEWEATIVLKGPKDFIADPTGAFFINTTGHPIMTKGGTGDILAGIIAGFMAQGLSAFQASKEATFQWGKVGEEVAKKKGVMSTTEELLFYLPSGIGFNAF